MKLQVPSFKQVWFVVCSYATKPLTPKGARLTLRTMSAGFIPLRGL